MRGDDLDRKTVLKELADHMDVIETAKRWGR